MIRSVTTSRYSCPRQKIKCRPHPSPQFDTERGPLWRVQIITLHEMEKVDLAFSVRVHTWLYLRMAKMQISYAWSFCMMIAGWLNVKRPESCLLPSLPFKKVAGFCFYHRQQPTKLDSSFSARFRCCRKSLWAQSSQVDTILADILHLSNYIWNLFLSISSSMFPGSQINLKGISFSRQTWSLVQNWRRSWKMTAVSRQGGVISCAIFRWDSVLF